MRILFFDTETTGNTSADVLCQLAIIEQHNPEPIINALYNPQVPIPIECTMIHHITNAMVKDKPVFQASPEYKQIKELFESPDTICVAHNASFDEQILKNDDIHPTNIICTFKVIRQLDDAQQFKMHKLQYLRYALDISITASAHDALGDVQVLEHVFQYELDEAMKKWNMTQDEALAEMMRITSQPLSIRNFDFGKYKGKSVAEVASIDPGYLSWLLDQKMQNNTDGKENDWIATLKKHLNP